MVSVILNLAQQILFFQSHGNLFKKDVVVLTCVDRLQSSFQNGSIHCQILAHSEIILEPLGYSLEPQTVLKNSG